MADVSREPLRKDERSKAAFLTGYRELCEQHQMMVGMVQDQKYLHFVVFCYSMDLPAFEKAMTEMLVEDMIYLEPLLDEEDNI